MCDVHTVCIKHLKFKCRFGLGPFDGLKMILNPQLSEYMTGVLYNNYFQQGFAISVNYADEPMMPDVITVAPSNQIVTYCHCFVNWKFSGTSVNVAMKPIIRKINRADFPLRPPLCNQNPKLEILNGLFHNFYCINS